MENEQVHPMIRDILNNFAHPFKCKCSECEDQRGDYLYHCRKDEEGEGE